MKLYDNEILKHLNKECNGSPIHFVGLGSFDFQLSFGGIERIQNMEKVTFQLSGTMHTWEEGTISAPVWLLVNQVPTAFELISQTTLRMNLNSGDYIDFATTEGDHECMIIHFGVHDGAIVMEIF